MTHHRARIYAPCPFCGVVCRWLHVVYYTYPTQRPVLIPTCRQSHERWTPVYRSAVEVTV